MDRCWSHGRRKFYELADIAVNKRRGKRAPPILPLALETVERIDALFDIERAINGETAERRLAVRQEQSAPLVAELEDWMRTERAGLGELRASEQHAGEVEPIIGDIQFCPLDAGEIQPREINPEVRGGLHLDLPRCRVAERPQHLEHGRSVRAVPIVVQRHLVPEEGTENA